MMRSTSIASTPATARASRAALTESVVVVSSSAAMRRSLMPVRLTIHSSVVFTIFARSSFVMTRSGAYIPHPVITAFVMGLSLGLRSSRVDLQQWLLALHQRPVLDEDAGDPPRRIGLDLVEQLHCLDKSDHLAGGDLVPVVDVGPGAGRRGRIPDPCERGAHEPHPWRRGAEGREAVAAAFGGRHRDRLRGRSGWGGGRRLRHHGGRSRETHLQVADLELDLVQPIALEAGGEEVDGLQDRVGGIGHAPSYRLKTSVAL